MENMVLILISLALSLFLAYFLSPLVLKLWPESESLPPGPPAFPVVGNLLWLRHSFYEIESVLRRLRDTYGPIVTLHIGFVPVVVISDADLAHKILVQRGALFADRPPTLLALRVLHGNQCVVSESHFGPAWRVLRRNMTAVMLHPSRIKEFSHYRRRAGRVLIGELRRQADRGEPVVVLDSFRYAIFSLLCWMCFGENLEEKTVREIQRVQHDITLHFNKVNVFVFFPRVGKYIFPRLWEMIGETRRRREDLFVPMIKARRERIEEVNRRGEESFQFSYLDSLLNLELPDEEGRSRKLTEEEIICLCSEILSGGTDTTVAVLQSIMANLVKHHDIQAWVYEEISAVVGDREDMEEDALGKLPFLRAVIMEGLQRHPPAHFLVSHSPTEDATVGGYLIPRRTTVNVMVTEMNWNSKVWSDPMEFRPERFLLGGEGEGLDITCSKEIKMLTFGAGRRACPGLGLAMLHLEYFVANMVREFEWTAANREVDMSEQMEFTYVMKTPLKATILPRVR
ncbi:unnamed protein product [Spirodela intermedia]|uniref:Uncharacterized protein n=1 Tax=Spirodela intermedia TaxID=51605 RepID=A0A7I8LAV2_SPIIN|nr:unnamed protein product [Spirodela intermedia]